MGIKITNNGGTLYIDAINWVEQQSCGIPVRSVPTRMLGSKVDTGTYDLKSRNLNIACRLSNYEKQILDKIFKDTSKVTITTGEGLEYVENGDFEYNSYFFDSTIVYGLMEWTVTGASWTITNGETYSTLVASAVANSSQLYQMFNRSYVKPWLMKLTIDVESFSFSSIWTYTGWLKKPVSTWDYKVYVGKAISASNITILQYYHKNSYSSGCGGTSYGIVKTEILYSDGTTTEVETSFANDVWHIVDLIGYLSAGKNVIGLRFQALKYGSGTVYIDDVSLVAT